MHVNTTDKVYKAMEVNCIPIYWGNPKINLDFNSKSSLNHYDYNNEEQLIEIDQNDDFRSNI